jgi:hypothetical protein
LDLQGNQVRIGADQAKSFEPLLANIADWLVDNPKPDWLKNLIDAKKFEDQQMYSY